MFDLCLGASIALTLDGERREHEKIGRSLKKYQGGSQALTVAISHLEETGVRNATLAGELYKVSEVIEKVCNDYKIDTHAYCNLKVGTR